MATPTKGTGSTITSWGIDNHAALAPANRDLPRLAERVERFQVRPLDQLDEVSGGKLLHLDDGDPAMATPVSGRLHAGHIGQLDEPVRGNLRADAPSLRIAGLEIGEFPAADRVDKKVVGLAV